MTLTFGSLFAGIGGFDLAFERAGMQCLWQVENNAQCNEVLAHHWPDVKRYGDVKDVGRHNLKPVDLICGGFPCQDLSVAGRREGLAGERSGLWWEFLRIIEDLNPEWVVIENVPGLLSSDKGRDMGTVLGGLGECGYRWAYRVLDAQFFGVPQRRRRVFIIASLGEGCPEEVLFERESSPWDPPPGREEGQRVTQSLTGGARSSSAGNPDDNRAQGNFLIPVFNKAGHERWEEDITAQALCRRDYKETCHLIPEGFNASGKGWWRDGVGPVTHTEQKGERNVVCAHETGKGWWNEADQAGTLRAEGENRPSRPSNVVAFDRTTAQVSGEQSGTLRCNSAKAEGVNDGKADNQCVAFQLTGDRDNPNVSTYDDIHPTLSANPMSDRKPAVAIPINTMAATRPESSEQNRQTFGVGEGVRRLTPTECERLQGFPDGWTAVQQQNGKPMSDSARYRMLGNAVAVPVAEWLGRRIVEKGEHE